MLCKVLYKEDVLHEFMLWKSFGTTKKIMLWEIMLWEIMLCEVFLYVYAFYFKSCTSVKSNTTKVAKKKKKTFSKKPKIRILIYRNRNSKVQYWIRTTCRVPTSTLMGSFCIFSISKVVSNIFLTKGRDI